MNNLETMTTIIIGEKNYEIADGQVRDNMHDIRYSLLIETDAKYFDIDYDGIISLKPEYRGNPVSTETINAQDYPFAISDRGEGNEGSIIDDLPERIVIPYAINEIAVTGFQEGMFWYNKRVKQIRFPDSITKIPRRFCNHAINLELLENTEHIEEIGDLALSYCSIRKALFPNLKELGAKVFMKDTLLVIADIGNQISTLKSGTFQDCYNLSCVLGGNNITEILVGVFKGTRRLKNLSFLPQLTSIGRLSFFDSRVRIEDVYDTLVSNGCQFGDYATYKQINTDKNNYFHDYWTGVEYTPCEIPLKSLFHQKNPEWASNHINDTYYEYGANGCSLIVMAEIYSAFENEELSSPEVFAKILKEKNLHNENFTQTAGSENILKGLGYTITTIKKMDAQNLKKVYDALLNGALVKKSMGTTDDMDSGHAILVYGVNSIGELLIADSDVPTHIIEKYENHKSTMPISALGSAECDLIIVEKPKSTNIDQ